MKKVLLFGFATLVAFGARARLAHVAQARIIVAPTPTPAPVLSAR